MAILFRSILFEFVSSGTSVGFFVFFFFDLLGRKEGAICEEGGAGCCSRKCLVESIVVEF